MPNPVGGQLDNGVSPEQGPTLSQSVVSQGVVSGKPDFPPARFAFNPGTPTSPTPQPRSVVTEYAVRTSYVWDYGIIASPVAGPDGTPCEITKLHAEICYKVVDWHTQRVGEPCILPSANTRNFNEVLCGKRISPQMPGIDAQNLQVWTCSGQYVYLLRTPPAENDPLACGSSPYDVMPAEGNWLTTKNFDRSILGNSPPVSVVQYNSDGTITNVPVTTLPVPFAPVPFDSSMLPLVNYPAQPQQNPPAPPG